MGVEDFYRPGIEVDDEAVDGIDSATEAAVGVVVGLVASNLPRYTSPSYTSR